MRCYVNISIIPLLYSIILFHQKGSASRHRLQKRSLLELAAVVECATNRSSVDYYGYGCYCGFGGRGYPVDEIDRCCFDHDRCYDMAVDFGICDKWRRYLQGYNWTCKNSRAICNDKGTSCAAYLCHCDAAAASCFSKEKYPADKPSCPYTSSTPDFSS